MLTIGATQSFALGAKGTSALVKGWSASEPWGVWSDGKKAQMTLKLDPALQGKDIELEFSAQAFVREKAPKQTVTVSVSGKQLATWEYAVGGTTGGFSSVVVPAALNSKPGVIELNFSFPQAVAPAAVGESTDARVLAVGISNVTLKQPTVAAPASATASPKPAASASTPASN